jgi:hypothetical protein
MRFLIITILLFCQLEIISAQTIDKNPIFSCIIKEHWGGPLKSTNPEFVLYSDGTIIYQKDDESTLYTIKLDDKELKNSFNIKKMLDILEVCQNNYETAFATCQDTYYLYYWKDGFKQQVEVYGYPKAPGFPGHLTEIFEKLIDFNHNDAVEWTPKEIELELIYTGQRSIFRGNNWPLDFPKISSNQKHRCNILIDYNKISELDELTTNKYIIANRRKYKMTSVRRKK